MYLQSVMETVIPDGLRRLLARGPRSIRWLVGFVLLAMAIRGEADELLGLADWSGSIWSFTSSQAVWISIGAAGLGLLTIDLWWPLVLSARHDEGSRSKMPAETPPVPDFFETDDGAMDANHRQPKPSPSRQPSAVKTEPNLKAELTREKVHGQTILGAIKFPTFQQAWMYEKMPSRNDVEPWKVNVDHALKGRDDLLNLFHYAPPAMLSAKFGAIVLDSLRGGPEVRRLERLLEQLDRVIEHV
jgi:hypothetical protein